MTWNQEGHYQVCIHVILVTDKYITLSNQNGTISLFKEITYLSKVLRYHGPIIIAKLDSLFKIWIWGVLRGVDCLPERGKTN